MNKEKNELVLVSCSGGFDSSITLSTLRLSKYNNIIACHFKYGHRGEEAEEMAIKNVCNELDIPLKIFDLSHIYKEINTTGISMLQDEDSEIITGTEKGLKTVAAWTVSRNCIFMTLMGALGEAECMRHNYDTIYLCGGFLQLSESATYPDGTPYFADGVLNSLKYGTLIGNRFKVLYCLSNIMKSEQFYFMKEMGLENVYKYTISCDRPIVTRDPMRFGGGPNNRNPTARRKPYHLIPLSPILNIMGSTSQITVKKFIIC
jgi:7-cyano-7-deazaguanine synthase in queuosine biosynthesis